MDLLTLDSADGLALAARGDWHAAAAIFEGALDAPQDIGFMLWMHPAPEIRRLTAVEGVAEIEAIPEVRTVVQRIRGGDVVDWGLGSLGNVLDVRGFAPDYETVRRVREKALSALVISGTSASTLPGRSPRRRSPGTAPASSWTSGRGRATPRWRPRCCSATSASRRSGGCGRRPSTAGQVSSRSTS